MNEHTAELIKQLLTEAFKPSKLIIQDDSAKHAKHPGSNGGGHYTIEIVSEHFENKSSIERHRMIYAVLADLMPAKIHALSLSAKPGPSN